VKKGLQGSGFRGSKVQGSEVQRFKGSGFKGSRLRFESFAAARRVQGSKVPGFASKASPRLAGWWV